MQIRFSELPHEIKDRLKEIQKTPDEFAGFYLAGGGKGWAIFGIILGISCLLGMAGIVMSEALPMGAWVCLSLFTCWLFVASIRHIKAFNAAEIKPFTFLNPLYFTKVTTTGVTYYNLWSDREDLNITHHYTNGVYTNTEFNFTFKNGSELLYVSPKNDAEELIDLIDTYRVHMVESLENEDFEAIMGHDIFFELERGDGLQGANETEKKSGGFAWGVWGLTAAVAVMMSGGLYYASAYAAQSRRLDRCEYLRTSKYYGPVRCFKSYFKYTSPRLQDERAREGLYGAYKKRFEADSVSARKTREWMAQREFKYLDGDRAGKLKAHMKKEGTEALKFLYKKAIDTYTKKARTANPNAKKAIIKIMELARDQGNYLVKLTYKPNIQAANQSTYTSKGKTYQLQPMTPSFKPRHNRAREAVINKRIQRAFKKIIPEDILSFTDMGDLELNIGYSLRPESMYTKTNKRTRAKTYFRGIRIFWHLRILNKGKLLYEYLDTTRPAQRFSVRTRYRRRYGSRSNVPNVTVYDKMAKTVFDNYGRRLLVHFGVKRPSYSDLKARRWWALLTKVGALKDLAAGKSWKEINIRERMKKMGIKAPKKRARTRRTNYRKRYKSKYTNSRARRERMRKLRQRLRRLRRNRRNRRYRRKRYRRRPSARRNWME